jgi:methyl-accepting chemotaxis protein
VAAEWDTRQLMTSLRERSRDLVKLVNKADTNQWIEKGAPEQYAAQKKTLSSMATVLDSSTLELARRPEKLSSAIQVLFQLQAIEQHLSSLASGARNYQDDKTGDELGQLWTSQIKNRDDLKRYIEDLAVTLETETDVIRKEAQRCRTEINRRPSDPPIRRRK